MAHSGSNVRVILVRPEKAGNIGAAVRAAANFPAESVWIVNPANWDDETQREARVASAGGWDHVAIHVCKHLEDAAADCYTIAGTSARNRAGFSAAILLDEFFKTNKASQSLIGVLFGPESQGLSTEEMGMCHYWIKIPSTDSFGSLNLAQAVLLVLYEAGREEKNCIENVNATASISEQERALTLLCSRLNASNSQMEQFRRLLHRAKPAPGDVAMLINLAKKG